MKEILLSIGAIVISVINMVAKMNMTGDVFDKIIGDKFTDWVKCYYLYLV